MRRALTAMQTTRRQFYRPFLLAIGLAVAVNTLSANQARAADVTLQSVETSTRLPVANADYPTPRDGDQLFFLQRSMNANTVVYRLNRTANGEPDASDPVVAYWRRYNTSGEATALSFFERRFAFGVTARGSAPAFDIEFRALSDIDVVLRSDADPIGLFTAASGRNVRLIYGYLDLDETRAVPAVVGLRLYGRDEQNNTYVTLIYDVTGGDIRQ